MRLAVICRPETSNARYRAILPLQEMQRRGHTVMGNGHPSFELLGAGGVPNWDLLHIQQFVGQNDLETILRLREAGIAVVWDSDDDVSAAPRRSDTYKRLGGRRKVRQLYQQTIELARAAHLFTTTNPHLAQIYKDEGVEHVQVIENYVAPEDVGQPRPRHQGVTIGLVAAGEHVDDLRKLKIAAVLERILREHDGVRVIALGLDLKLRDHRYAHNPSVPIAELMRIVRQFDIGLAPLVDSPMSRARSNVKLKEYAAGGAMWLASPIGPYVGLGEQQGGLLVDDGDWHATIAALVRDHERRRELMGRAQKWVRTQTAVQGGDHWVAAFRDAIVRARREAGR